MSFGPGLTAETMLFHAANPARFFAIAPSYGLMDAVPAADQLRAVSGHWPESTADPRLRPGTPLPTNLWTRRSAHRTAPHSRCGLRLWRRPGRRIEQWAKARRMAVELIGLDLNPDAPGDLVRGQPASAESLA